MATDHNRAKSPACDLRGKCPIQAVHNRLEAAHLLWHHALDSYCDPDGFRTYLNSCIQELRNVTFVLQKHKARIPDFATWYSSWQVKMKSDPALRWLVEARNRIVKQGDLETSSVARVSVVQGYVERVILVVELNPLLSTEEIAADIANRPLPRTLSAEGLLRIERRWIAKDLPTYELLDTLAHSYGVLSTLVSDAHRQAGGEGTRVFVRQCDGSVEPYPHNTEHMRGRLPCMVVTDDRRTVWVDLATKESVMLHSRTIPVTPENSEVGKALIRHYGVPTQLSRPDSGRKGLRDFAESLFELARRVLEIDGYHTAIVFLILDEGGLEQRTMYPETMSDKMLLWATIAQDVERTGACALVFVSESWLAPHDPEHPERTATESPDRIEVLTLTAASMDGDEFTLMCTFERRDGDIDVGEAQEYVAEWTPFLGPVREVWNRRKAPE